jgi:hypothetical protein
MGDHVSAAVSLAGRGKQAKRCRGRQQLRMQGKGKRWATFVKKLVQAGAMVLRNLINLELVEIHRINGQRRTGYDDQPPSLDTACDLDDEHNVYSLPREGLTLEDHSEGGGWE